jgi:hypothetical protein
MRQDFSTWRLPVPVRWLYNDYIVDRGAIYDRSVYYRQLWSHLRQIYDISVDYGTICDYLVILLPTMEPSMIV